MTAKTAELEAGIHDLVGEMIDAGEDKRDICAALLGELVSLTYAAFGPAATKRIISDLGWALPRGSVEALLARGSLDADDLPVDGKKGN